MNDERPNKPDPLNERVDHETRERSPNSIDPTARLVGFPSEDVDYLRSEANDSGDLGTCRVDAEALSRVLGWIDRYVPHAVRTYEDAVVVDGIRELYIDLEPGEPFDLIRLNGRVFVPEAPVAFPEGGFTAGPCQVFDPDGQLDGAAVFEADGEPYCLIGPDMVLGGDPIPRAAEIARVLNEAGPPPAGFEDGESCPPHCCCCGPGEPCCDCGAIMPETTGQAPTVEQ